MSEGVIKEGFLCPICHVDMRSPKTLLAHFQEKHSEEQDVLKSVKELVGKAKNKFLKFEEKEIDNFSADLKEDEDEFTLINYLPQDVGQSRSHISYFKKVRRERLDHHTSETNKLIIRLDRFLRAEGSDKKQIAQELVTWLDGTTVTRCPSCTVSFNLARRQHHCRLCGSIMCNSCSRFLTYQEARDITTPMHTEKQVQRKDDAETLRICTHCENMLDLRKRLQLKQSLQPLICQLYTELQKLKTEIQQNVNTYLKVRASLKSGETVYLLQDGHILRSKIAHQAEKLDIISKQIGGIPPDPENAREFTLQTAIMKATSFYIKNNVLTLKALPTAQEIKDIREKWTRPTSTQAEGYVQTVQVTSGWSSDNIRRENLPSDDPILEQINNVCEYIKQAQEAGRMDEVVALRENLRMLQREHKSQRALSISTNYT